MHRRPRGVRISIRERWPHRVTALTRHMIGVVREQPNPEFGVIVLAGATLILSLAVLIIRFTSARYPSPTLGEAGRSGIRVD